MDRKSFAQDCSCEYPLVTCIITCYKKFSYLFDAIDSVLQQDYPKIELLVTDDGSEQFPQTAVEEFIQERGRSNIVRWHVNHHIRNVGTVRNINSMLKIAKGEYFIGLDGDDVFYDNAVFRKIVNRFKSTGVDFLSCSRLQCTEQLEPVKVLPTPEQKKEIALLDTARKQFESFAVFRFLDMASGSAMYFSRGNLNRMGLFDEQYRNWQDGPRIAEYVRLGNCIPTAFDIVSVRYRDGGVSNAPRKNSDAFVHISADRERYIKSVLEPDTQNRNKKQRRNILFWYNWDKCETVFQRFMVMIRYPGNGISVLLKKVFCKPIR